MCEIAIVKLGAEGSLIKANDMIYKIPVYKVKAIDTVGAGDMYAAGILYGIANGIDMEKAGKIASYAAAQIVATKGGRLGRSLKDDISKI